MKEAPVEQRLKTGLEVEGFKVLKLTTPGTQFTPDRLILRPTWSPGPPYVIEVKRPGKTERRGQELIRDDWRKRGVLVLDMVNTYEQVDALVERLYTQCCDEAPLSVEAIARLTALRRYGYATVLAARKGMLGACAAGRCDRSEWCHTHRKCYLAS